MSRGFAKKTEHNRAPSLTKPFFEDGARLGLDNSRRLWYCKVKLSRCAPWGARALEGRQPRHEAKHKRKEKNGTRANADRAWARSAYVSHRRRTAQNFYFVARKKRRGQAPQQGKHRKSLFLRRYPRRATN